MTTVSIGEILAAASNVAETIGRSFQQMVDIAWIACTHANPICSVCGGSTRNQAA
jgi:adenine-specific DNA glycosylase